MGAQIFFLIFQIVIGSFMPKKCLAVTGASGSYRPGPLTLNMYFRDKENKCFSCTKLYPTFVISGFTKLSRSVNQTIEFWTKLSVVNQLCLVFRPFDLFLAPVAFE